MKPILSLRNVCKYYRLGDEEIRAVDHLNLDINQGEMIAIMGPSGSGKSTLMHLAGLLDKPDCGEIILNSKPIKAASEAELARLRNREIGFVFQTFNLLPRIPSWENVSLPLIYAGQTNRQKRFLQAKKMLETVGLADRIYHNRAQLSGGQQQRVAIARALINNPSIIFADEPTGNLDSKSGQQIMSLLTKLNKQGRIIVIVTHETNIARYAKRRVTLKDGRIIADRQFN